MCLPPTPLFNYWDHVKRGTNYLKDDNGNHNDQLLKSTPILSIMLHPMTINYCLSFPGVSICTRYKKNSDKDENCFFTCTLGEVVESPKLLNRVWGKPLEKNETKILLY